MIYVAQRPASALNVILHGLTVMTQDAQFFYVYLPKVPGHATAVGSFGFEQLILPTPGNGTLQLTLNVPGWPAAGAQFQGPDAKTDIVVPVPSGSTFRPDSQSVCCVKLPRTDILRVSVAPRNGTPIFENGAIGQEPDPIPYIIAFPYRYTDTPTLTDAEGNHYFRSMWPQPNLHIWSTQPFAAGPLHTQDELSSFNAMFSTSPGLKGTAATFAANNPTLPYGVNLIEIQTIPELMRNAMGAQPMEDGRAHCFPMWVG